MQKDIAKKKIQYCNIKYLNLTKLLILKEIENVLLRNRRKIIIMQKKLLKERKRLLRK